MVVDVGSAAVARLGALETLAPVEGLDGRGQLLQPVDLRLLEGGEQVAHAHPPRVVYEQIKESNTDNCENVLKMIW